MEERTQIKFSDPDIDGTSRPQLITLEKEDPIEGQSETGDGEAFAWHKWLCTNGQYFMASDSLDAMLKCIPNKVSKPIKIEKVINPNGGFNFFKINGMSKDELVRQVEEMPIETAMPPQGSTVPASNTEGSFARLEQKLDRIINMLNAQPVDNAEEEIPF